MKVVVLPSAEDDLVEIEGFVALDDPEAADRLVSLLFDRCASLGDQPRSGRVVANRGQIAIRMIVQGRYLILYTVDGDTLHVRRIRHGARSPRLLLKGLDLP